MTGLGVSRWEKCRLLPSRGLSAIHITKTMDVFTILDIDSKAVFDRIY